VGSEDNNYKIPEMVNLRRARTKEHEIVGFGENRSDMYHAVSKEYKRRQVNYIYLRERNYIIVLYSKGLAHFICLQAAYRSCTPSVSCKMLGIPQVFHEKLPLSII
jgi:hypothetical protein